MAQRPKQRPQPRRTVFKLFLAEKSDPEPFYTALAARAVAELPFELSRARVLDLGSGPGHYTRALRDAGAAVVPVDADPIEVGGDVAPVADALVADARSLPFERSSFDGVFCSNVLEHSPDTSRIFREIERVLRPGGWGWVSWTNWYSPWGGHEITPFHYLGPSRGLAVHRRLRGEPRKNVPGIGLFPVHIGRTLALARACPGLKILDVMPRYYPSQRWIVRVPGVREVLTWNCLIVLERVADGGR